MNLEEIDFKIKNIKTGVILDCSYIDSIIPMDSMITVITSENGDTMDYNLNEWEILRNTGINDTDGNSIYEGDTVHQYSVLIGNTDIDIVGEVKFLEGAWMVVNEEKKQGYPLWNECIENKLVDER